MLLGEGEEVQQLHTTNSVSQAVEELASSFEVIKKEILFKGQPSYLVELRNVSSLRELERARAENKYKTIDLK